MSTVNPSLSLENNLDMSPVSIVYQRALLMEILFSNHIYILRYG